jgi:hypothetical protein
MVYILSLCPHVCCCIMYMMCVMCVRVVCRSLTGSKHHEFFTMASCTSCSLTSKRNSPAAAAVRTLLRCLAKTDRMTPLKSYPPPAINLHDCMHGEQYSY